MRLIVDSGSTKAGLAINEEEVLFTTQKHY
jgi:hypothetical protein